MEQLAEQIAAADAVVVGIGSGLSTAAGYDHYRWVPPISDWLADFRDHYGYKSPGDGFYYCYSSFEEQWAYYARYIRCL